MTYNKTTVSFGALRTITGPAIQWQYNVKQTLFIRGLDLPENYLVDFCNEGDATTISMPASLTDGVEIPDQFLQNGKRLIALIVVVDGESVNTIAQATFPVNGRGARTDIEPEPAEQQQIDSLVDRMNEATEAVEQAAEIIRDGALSVDDDGFLFFSFEEE